VAEELRIYLFGSSSVVMGEEPRTGFVLSGLLWSDAPDATVRKNLRDVLSNLRQLLGPCQLITRQTVVLNPDALPTVASMTPTAACYPRQAGTAPPACGMQLPASLCRPSSAPRPPGKPDLQPRGEIPGHG